MADPSTDTSELIRACCDAQNAAAWREFIRRFRKPIAGTVMRTCARWGERSRDAVDDLVQEVYVKFCADNCRLLREFEHEHPNAFHGYVKVVASNLVNDHFRALYAGKRGGGKKTEEITERQYAGPPAQSGSSQSIERHVLLAEIDRWLERCTQGSKTAQRDRQIFRLYYRQKLSAKAIAAIPGFDGLTAKGVESAILRLTRQVSAEIAGEKKRARAEKVDEEKGLSQPKTSMQGEAN